MPIGGFLQFFFLFTASCYYTLWFFLLLMAADVCKKTGKKLICLTIEPLAHSTLKAVQTSTGIRYPRSAVPARTPQKSKIYIGSP